MFVQSIKDKKTISALLGPAIVFSLCALKAPEIMHHGRFWAEEGVVFFADMQGKSWLSQIFYIYKGQIQLATNIVMAIALHVSLKFAPLVSSYGGLLTQAILAFLIIAWAEHLRITYLFAIALASLIVISPDAVESFMSATNMQWTLSCIMFLIIQLPDDVLRKRPTTWAVVTIVLGLSGIPMVMLAPVAGLRAWVLRSRSHAMIAALLVGCALVQAALLMHVGVEGTRSRSTDPYVYLMAPFLQLIVKHTLGSEATQLLGTWLAPSTLWSASSGAIILAPVGLVAASLGFVVKNPKHPLAIDLAALFYVIVFNIYGCLGEPRGLISVYGMRYFFLPAFILGLIVSRLHRENDTWLRGATAAAMLLAVGVSLHDLYFTHMFDMLTTAEPDWRREIDRCWSLPGPCAARIMPQGWTVNIVLPPSPPAN